MVQEDLICCRCNDSCYGDVVHLQGKYYHQYCFTCKKCNIDLVETGYFEVDGEFYCNNDYHKIQGTKCDGCGKFIEGEAVKAMDLNFHQECFGCHRCGKLFPPEVKIIFDGEDFICETCDQASTPKTNPKENTSDAPIEKERLQEQQYTPPKEIPPPYQVPQTMKIEHGKGNEDGCAGCGNDIKSGQALLALEKQWHLWCFTCHKCGCLLAGEYMGRDGVPYCEQDYQTEFGVTCAGCGGYITGKVLQAGEKHYHPHCSRCAKCGDMFGEGEEMYLQGSEIWHPHCSEEYQRENEELEREAAIESCNGLQVESFSLGTEDQSPQRSPNLRNHSSPPQYDDYNSQHGKQASYSSEDSNRNGHSQPPAYDDYLKNKDKKSDPSVYMSKSVDVKNNNIWQPNSDPNEKKPLPAYNDFIKNKDNTNKPVGFRSVRPPQDQKEEKPPSPTPSEGEEEPPPPVPPPPTRSSSSAWKQKYTGKSGVYTAKPFHKQNDVSQPTDRRINRTSMSFVDSAAARTDKPTQNGADDTKRTNVSVSSVRTISTSSSNEGKDERDTNDGNRRSVKKGVGFNKLQLRKSLQGSHTNSATHALDPEILKKLNSDPNGNTYPYEVLKTNSYKTPTHLNRQSLETYLTDEEFEQVFQMNRSKFYSLPKWKQEDLKRKVTLF